MEENEITDNNRTDSGNEGRDRLGRFAAGNPGKPHGSTKNKLRDDLKKFVTDNVGKIEEWMKDLSSREKIDVITSLMPYVVPRLKQVDVTAVIEDNTVKKPFPFGGYVDGNGKWVVVDDGAYFLDNKPLSDRDQVAALFPTDEEMSAEDEQTK